MLYLSSKGEKVYMGMTLKKMDFKELTMWYDNARYEYELADEKECIITLFEITPDKINMNSVEKYDSFVDGLNEVVHGFTKTLSDEKLLEYDTITLINLQLISIMTN